MFWVSIFLDLPASSFDRGAEFWCAVTGFGLSPLRGERREFATLVPPEGDDHLRVQRVLDGAGGIHLDVHVEDPRAAADAAASLGATEMHDRGYVVMRSPGGFTFCLVDHPAGHRAPATAWPEGHRSIADQVCLDIPADAYDVECGFWSALTGWDQGGFREHNEFRHLERPDGMPVRFLLQRLGEQSGSVRAHVDFATDDRPAEVRRHAGLGARLLAERSGWSVLRDPAGLVYCVTDRDPTAGRQSGRRAAGGMASVPVMDTITRTDPRTTVGEAETLQDFLDFHRQTMRMKTAGLDAAQLDQPLAPSTMTLGGMLKHLALVEQWWFHCVFAGHEYEEPFASVDWKADDDWDWHSAADDTPEDLRGLFDAEVARSEHIVAEALNRGSLDQLSVRRSRTGDSFNLRWILVHMIEEYSRHNGHADLIRESVDGEVGE